MGAASSATRFVSHSWFPPSNWKEVMGSQCIYAEMKATELQRAVVDLEEGAQKDEFIVTFWIDKCCIPQQHDLMTLGVSLIEEFVERCEGMIVVLTWQYFERLWCVFEWATMLA